MVIHFPLVCKRTFVRGISFSFQVHLKPGVFFFIAVMALVAYES